MSAAASTSFVTNQKWILKRRPTGVFDPKTDSELVSEEIDFTSCKDDEVIVESNILSVDAFLRTMLDEEAYHGNVPLGGTIPAFGIGKIIYAGPKAKKKVGNEVLGMFGAQKYSVSKSDTLFPKITFPLMPHTACLGLMGLTTGLTAYAGVFYVCQRPKAGETVVVTAAAGAVGNVAAQLAKSTGARVVGIAGGEVKKNYLLNDLKLDAAIDYKAKDKTLDEQLDECCPNGIDFVYDNVGGETLDALLSKINPKARVVICGAISQYSGNLNKDKVRGPSNYLKLAERGAEMKGFNVMQYMMRAPLMMLGMFWLYVRGKVDVREHYEAGIGSFALALQKLFTGGHIGKLLVDLKEL